MKDIILFKPWHEEIAKRVIPAIYELDNNKTLLISVFGRSGTGKTEIAHLIERYCKEDGFFCKIVGQDRFYKEGHEYERCAKGLSVVGHKELRWDLINNAIGNLIHSRTYDAVIFEGIYSRYYKQGIDLSIYLDATDAMTFKFRKERGKEIINRHRKAVLNQEGYAIDFIKDLADITIDLKEYIGG